MKLFKVRHIPSGKEFFAYPAMGNFSQELEWYRPRRWGGETFYWKDQIEVIRPGVIKEYGMVRMAVPGEMRGWL